MRWFLIIVIFILLAGFFIISNNNLHFNNAQDAVKFVSYYYNWLGNIIGNIGEVTAQVIKSDWFPGKDINSTIAK